MKQCFIDFMPYLMLGVFEDHCRLKKAFWKNPSGHTDWDISLGIPFKGGMLGRRHFFILYFTSFLCTLYFSSPPFDGTTSEVVIPCMFLSNKNFRITDPALKHYSLHIFCWPKSLLIFKNILSYDTTHMLFVVQMIGHYFSIVQIT